MWLSYNVNRKEFSEIEVTVTVFEMFSLSISWGNLSVFDKNVLHLENNILTSKQIGGKVFFLNG